MDKRRGSWLAHGTSGRCPSRVLKPDDSLLRGMVLNLMTIVGFVFLALILLHLLFGHQIPETLYVYAALFLAIEAAAGAARLYFHCRKRANCAPLINDVENIVQSEERNAKSKEDHTSYSGRENKTLLESKKDYFNDLPSINFRT